MDGSLYDMLRNHNFNGKSINASNEWTNYSVYEEGYAWEPQQASQISSFHTEDIFSSGIECQLVNSNCNSLSGNVSNPDYVRNKGQLQRQQSESVIPISTSECSPFLGAPLDSSYVLSSHVATRLKHIILMDYAPYKGSKWWFGGRGRLFFLEQTHRKLCTTGCVCWMIQQTTDHFDGCVELNCNLCGPHRKLHIVSFSPGVDSGSDMLHCAKRRRVADGLSIQIPANFNSQLADYVSQLVSSPTSVITSTHEMENIDNVPSSSLKNNLLPCAKRGRVMDECSIQIPSSFESQIISSPDSDFKRSHEMDNVGFHAPSTFPEIIFLNDMEILRKDGTNFNENLLVSESVSQEDDSKNTGSRKGVALTDFFTAEELREHIQSLQQNVNKGSLDVPEAKDSDCANVDICQLCAVGKLYFAPPPIYCSFCSARIKHNVNYYFTVDPLCHYFCTSCYGATRSHFTLNGTRIHKTTLSKTRNEEKEDESWVQCDRCQRWQHQICALFNDKKNIDGKAEYICPICSLKEMKRRTSGNMRAAVAFYAKDLPRSELSDLIEQRIFRILKQERLERASAAGKNCEEVPGAEDIVVRVVSSVKKRLKVGEKFLSLFEDNQYPSELPYNSKGIFMFQRIDGADVCLFAMYVQEFGSESPRANRNSVYVSYIDSVKYFRPDIKSVWGESLRTIVYHNILLGYFEYCKNIGFRTGYIWSSPPKGYREEYIFYCHPEDQKIPKTKDLRKWYISVLRKAVEQKIALGFTNLHDHLFSHSRPTAARLPHFEGAYWTTAAEDMIRDIDDISREELQRRAKKIYCRTNCIAIANNGVSVRHSKHILLMDKIGEAILPFKDDFFVLNLQSLHPSNPCTDSILGNSLFDTGSDFLTACEENRYQFDTLRRAKHSTMMILHQFQTSGLPTLLAF